MRSNDEVLLPVGEVSGLNFGARPLVDDFGGRATDGIVSWSVQIGVGSMHDLSSIRTDDCECYHGSQKENASEVGCQRHVWRGTKYDVLE